MKRLVSILLFISISFYAVRAQDVKVTAVFDSTRIYVGDQTLFTVTIEKPLNYKLTIPLFKDSIQSKIEILKGPLFDTTLLNNGRIRLRQKYLITSFDSGFYNVPPVYAELKEESGIKRFYSDYSQLKVMRVKLTPSDTTAKIFDIVKPYRVPLTLGEVMPWVLLALLIIVLVWFIVRFIKNRKRKKTGYVPIVNPDPAHVIAFRQLEKLKEDKLWEKGDLKGYYTRLTEIVRFYLENRYSILSLELTTIETLAELKKNGFKEDELYRKLRTVLTGADLVKFAKFNPESSENELLFEYSWEFVEKTKLVSVEQEGGDKDESKQSEA
jgi:hypothetical protein